MNRRKDRNRRGRAARAGNRSLRPTDSTADIEPRQTHAYGSNVYTVPAVCGLLLLAVIEVFGQTARHEFVNFDDPDYVYENQHVRGGLSGEGTAWAITAFHSGNWHPLTWLSHMLDCQVYNLKPAGHHLTSVLLHAMATVFLFLAFQRMTGAVWPSSWVAAVFAIHPLRVESVAWVAERKDVLSGLFFTLTIWFYARYAERPTSWSRYLLGLASFAMGLTAKPILVTLPFVLLLLDYWPLGRMGVGEKERKGAGSKEQEFQISNLKSQIPATPFLPFFLFHRLHAPRTFLALVVEKTPFFVLAAASCLVTLAAQQESLSSLEHLALPGRLANAAVAYVAYLGKTLYPVRLAALYPLSDVPPPPLEVVAAASVLLAISTAVVVARRASPYLLVGWLWYLGILVPVIGLVQVGFQAMADRYTYLPQIGLCIAFAWGAAQVAGSVASRWSVAAVATLLLAGLVVSAWQQTPHWRDSETLWTHTLACTSQNPVANYNFGVTLAGRGRVDEAIIQYQKALETHPDYADAHNNLGVVMTSRGQTDEAIVHFVKVLKIKPDNEKANYNLGLILAGRGQLDEAITHFRKALEISPDNAETHDNLGLALARRKQTDEAIAHFRKAIEINPQDVDAHNNLGIAMAGRGQVDEAIAHYRKALEINRDDMAAHYNLGNSLAGQRQVGEALEHYERALGLAIAK